MVELLRYIRFLTELHVAKLQLMTSAGLETLRYPFVVTSDITFPKGEFCCCTLMCNYKL